jgi:hypothetical protein
MQDSVVALGRVCAEADGHFSEGGVVLEASDDNQKARVKLDLRAAESFSLFPGQVVAEGVNNTGKVLNITKLNEVCVIQ